MSGSNKPKSAAPVTVHLVLTTVALLCAYLTWTRDRTQVQTDSVVALDLSKRDISALIWEDENRTVNLEKKATPDGESYAWVKVTTRSKQLVTNPGAPAPGMLPPTAPPPPAGMPPHGAHPGAPPAPPPGAHPGAPPIPGAHPGAPPAPPTKAPQKGGDKALAGKDPSTPTVPPTIGQQKPGAVPAPPTAAPPTTGPASVPPAVAAIHEVKETVTTKEFRGNEQADKVFELYAPMRVVRVLGVVDEKKTKELGLDNSKKSLTIVAKGQPVKFVLGNNSYGTGDIYARDPQGQVYLLGHRLVSDFEFAESRFMERRLHRFERGEFDRVEVQVTTAAGPKTRTLIQKNPEDNTNFYFADGASPDKRDDTLRNWMDKILRMAINDYVNKGDEPTPSPPVAGQPMNGDIVKMTFFKGKKQLGEATFSRYPNKSGQMEYYARTENTIGITRLLAATAESAIQDAEKW